MAGTRKIKKTLVGTARVREWGRENGWEVGSAGRLSSELIKDFNSKNKDEVYEVEKRSTATNRVTPASFSSAPAGNSTSHISTSVEGGVSEIMKMLEEAKANSDGNTPVLIAAYALV